MIGNVVGSYKITEKIGEGGMGAVFKGIDVMLEREVAIKMLRPELANNPQIVERFRSEAVTLAKLNHPNIATLYSFIRQGDDFFMVMEYVRGKTLEEMIRDMGAMAPERAAELLCHALEGIDHAHGLGVIHRDIKPANMMLTENGSIKVMDFGIARVLGTDRMTKTGHLIGTIEYMSPEQIRGLETDARADIYSLGILLYEMLTGRVPFTTTSEYELMRSHIEDPPPPPTDFAPNIPVLLEQAIMRSLAKRPEARFQTAGEFRVALQRSIRTATSPLEAQAVFRAPSTRLDLPASPPVAQDFSQDLMKATRLSNDPGSAAIAVASQLTPTRLLDSHEVPAGSASPAQQRSAAAPLMLLLGKLNWKHYAAAGAAMLVLIVASVVLLVGGDKTAQPPSSQQPTVGAPSSAPAQSTAQQSNQIEPEPSSTTQPDPLNRQPSDNSRARTTPSDPGAQPITPVPTPSAGEPQQSTPAPRKEEPKQGAVAKGDGKKEEKKGGLFGAIKGAANKVKTAIKGEDDKKPKKQ